MMALAMLTASASAQLKSGISMNDLDKSVRPADTSMSMPVVDG